METAVEVLYLLGFWLFCCHFFVFCTPIDRQKAISWLLPGRLTPSFQHCLSPSISSGLIRDGKGCGSALFAWFLTALQLLLCFVPQLTTKKPYLGFYQADWPHLFSIVYLHLTVLVSFAMETAVEVLYLLGFRLLCSYFYVLYPNWPPKSHILASARPIDPIFSAFFISVYLFWSDYDIN
jgi:hypothetical protein